jgi:hypothetical protein
MRGIDRVLAVLLLLGAVGGAAAFARQSGRETASPGVDLAAPPFQHVQAPGSFFVAPRLISPVKVAPVRRVTIPQATPRPPTRAVPAQNRPQPAIARPSAAPPAPAAVQAPPAPVQTPAPGPVQTPEPPRALAAVVQPASETHQGNNKGKDHGHAWGHLKHDDSAPPEAPVAPTDVSVVPPSQDNPSSDENGNGNDGHGNGNDNGNDHGHGSGHDQSGGPRQSGD